MRFYQVIDNANLLGTYDGISDNFRTVLRKEFDLLLPIGGFEYCWIRLTRRILHWRFLKVYSGDFALLIQTIERNLAKDLTDSEPDPKIKIEIRIYAWKKRRKGFCVYAAFKRTDEPTIGKMLFGEQLVIRKSVNEYVLIRHDYPN
jgi:hypothetical protein